VAVIPTTGDAKATAAADPKEGAPKPNTAPFDAANQYPPVPVSAVTSTTGALLVGVDVVVAAWSERAP